MSPGSICAAGDENGFQHPVHSFYHAVGFRVAGCSMVTRVTEEFVEGCPEEGCEGRISVGCNVLWTPNPETHAERKSAVQKADVASTMGTASGQWEEQSMMVKRYL